MTKLYQLKISLLDVEPVVWRRIVVPKSLTLLELHGALQGTMGWQDQHHHWFEIGGQQYELDDPEMGLGDGYLDERDHKLSSVLKGVKDFRYNYDPGDGWCHLVEVEAFSASLARRHFLPVCVDGENASPPENSGGPYRYMEAFSIMKDETHPEHEETRDWFGDFDPTKFNPEQASQLMLATCAFMRERGDGYFKMEPWWI